MAGNVEAELEKWLLGADKIVVAGIGNPIRQDDYVGLKIVEGLQGKVRGNVCLLECETVPESYLLDIEQFKPTHVLLIDAAVLGQKPGEAKLFEAEKIVDFPAITTHVLPLRIFCEYIKQATGAKIGLLLIEPKAMEFEEGLSDEVEAAAERLTALLLRLLG
ncbi:MAG: hydrogenase maturation protease [Chloroflexi bacterium]|nr:hydrogenase maturation protease [Chloroflexota bacterium]